MNVVKRSLVFAIVGAVGISLALPSAAAQAVTSPAGGDSANHQMGSWAHDGVSTRAIAGEAQTWAEQGVGGNINGVDIYQGDTPNYARLHAAGATFAFIKASEFVGGVEKYGAQYYPAQKAASVAAGIIPGTYQYAKPNNVSTNIATDAGTQARGLVARAGSPGQNQLPFVLDLETAPSSMSKTALTNWAVTWLNTVQSLTGRTPILYSYTSFINSRLSPSSALVGFPLWQADYNMRAPGSLPGWSTSNRLFWQFSSRGTVAGSNGGPIDLDTFVGNSAQWTWLTSGTGNGRSLDAARASLSRVSTAIMRISKRDGRAPRRLVGRLGHGRLVANKMRPIDFAVVQRDNFGHRGNVRAYIRTMWVGGPTCWFTRAGTVAYKWREAPCPARRWGSF